MAEQEINVIGHLLDVEKDASALVSDAQVESAKRVAAAHAQADAEYKKQYDTLISSLDARYATSSKETTQKHDEALNTYKGDTEKMPRDTEAFNKLLDSVLFSA